MTEVASDYLGLVDQALMKKTEFESIEPLHRKFMELNDERGLDLKFEYGLYLAYPTAKSAPIVIYDERDIVWEKVFEYSLAPAPEIADSVQDLLPSDPLKILNAKLKLWGDPPEGVAPPVLYYTPTRPLTEGWRDVLSRIEWGDFISQLTDFNSEPIDPDLRRIRLATLPKGVAPSYNANAIVAGPIAMGKSEYYDLVGKKADKVKANSIVGYADSEGKHPGSLDNWDFPYTIDQFESQGEFKILRYATSLMESGSVTIDTGARPFPLRSKAPIILLMNPKSSEPTKNFSAIMEHASKLPAFGRRFGLILHKTTIAKEHEVRNRLSSGEKATWKRYVEFYRAVEDVVLPEVRKLYENRQVREFLNSRPDQWVNNALGIIEPLSGEDADLYGMLEAFVTSGMPHTKGAALNCAIVINLKALALDPSSVDPVDLVAEAEDHVKELLDINESSLRSIVMNFKEDRDSMKAAFFSSAPTYIKNIIVGVDVWKRTSDDRPKRINLRAITYRPNGEYFSRVVDLARKKFNPTTYNPKLGDIFGFEIDQDGKDLYAVISDYSFSTISSVSFLSTQFIAGEQARPTPHPTLHSEVEKNEQVEKAENPDPASKFATNPVTSTADKKEAATRP